MSSDQSEERKELYIERAPEMPAATTNPALQKNMNPNDGPYQQAQLAPAAQTERREQIIRKRNTNTGAIAAIIVGVLVILFGMYLVFSQIRFLPAPYSYIVVLIVGLILIGVGAKLVTTRTSMP